MSRMLNSSINDIGVNLKKQAIATVKGSDTVSQ